MMNIEGPPGALPVTQTSQPFAGAPDTSGGGRDINVWRMAIESSAHAMVISSALAPEFPIEYVNHAFERITGYSAAEVIGRSCRFLQSIDMDQAGIQTIRDALHKGYPAHAVIRNYRKDGTLFWNHLFMAPVHDNEGVLTHFVASQYDITATKELEARLLHQATHDDLTGLPNRVLLRDRLTQAMRLSERNGHQVWVGFVSLDRFKAVNDSFGHGGGDEFLQIIAARLNGAVRASDTVARWGGDEFVILMPGAKDVPLASVALERLMRAVSESISYDGQEYVVTSSVGVSAYPADADSVDGLLQRAYTAAYAAKRDGNNRFRFHHAGATEMARARLQMEAQLRSALKREEFVVHYQPQVDLESGCVVGAEALVRWQHPTRGLIGPYEFIALAEECGLIAELGTWVLRAACAQNRRWQLLDLPRIRMSVNLSAAQFSRGDLAETVKAVLAEVGMRAADLELELTETVVMSNVEHGIEALRALKSLGVSVAIDDFGTGYSSLAYLKRFPIDVLKIDRSFVADIGNIDDDNAAIVASIIALAHTLKLSVIAEGVETLGQLNFLQQHACDEIQGYFASRPVDAASFERILSAGSKLLDPAPAALAGMPVHLGRNSAAVVPGVQAEGIQENTGRAPA